MTSMVNASLAQGRLPASWETCHRDAAAEKDRSRHCGHVKFSARLEPLHMYADVSQVYVSTPANNAAAAVVRLTACVADINDGMKASRLRLNPAKTRLMWLGTSQQLDKITARDVQLLSAEVTVVDSPGNLGIIINSQLSLDAHVAAVCRSGYYQLWQLRPVTRSLSADAAKTLVQAFISSQLDYCNALLSGVSDGLMHHLQSVQNTAARLVTGVLRCDHITPIL